MLNKTNESEVREMKILPLRIENGRLILDGVRLTGVEGYTIKISSEMCIRDRL